MSSPHPALRALRSVPPRRGPAVARQRQGFLSIFTPAGAALQSQKALILIFPSPKTSVMSADTNMFTPRINHNKDTALSN